MTGRRALKIFAIMRSNWSALFVLTLALSGAFILWYSTPWGPWAWSDSTEYLEAARNFAAGRGLVLIRATGEVVPLYLRPPLYSIILAAAARLGLKMISAARWLDIALFFGLLLTPLVFSFKTKDKYLLPAGISLYLLTSFAIVRNFTGLMSEPLFIFLTFITIAAATAFLSTHREPFLLLAAAAAGLAWLTRFAGVANILLVLALPLLNRAQPWRPKINAFIKIVLLGMLPFLLWSFTVRRYGYSPGVYGFSLNGIWDSIRTIIKAYVELLWNWFNLHHLVSDPVAEIKAIVVVPLFIALTAISLRLLINLFSGIGARDDSTFLICFGALMIGYASLHALLIAVSYLIVVLPQPALDQRVLLPSQITFVIGTIVTLYVWGKDWNKTLLRIALPLLIILPAVWNDAPATWKFIQDLHMQGGGYASKTWREARIVLELKNLPAGLSMISNDSEAIMYFIQRPAYMLPELENKTPRLDGKPFGSDPQSEIERLFANGQAVLVIFTSDRGSFDRVYGDNAKQRRHDIVNGLYPLYEDWDGGLYLISRP